MAVYFILGRNEMKIGYTGGSMDNRMSSLQTGSSFPLLLMKVIPNGTMKDERRFHRRFKHLHIRGEWFHFQDDLRWFVQPEVEERRAFLLQQCADLIAQGRQPQ